jgi:DNA-directed RNA polymerase I subunit RPA1
MDPLGTALPNGVYDPRLGPSTTDSPPCVTCAQSYAFCPGHFGHIELCVPLYHPLLFAKIVELLRMKCLHCHKLRCPVRTLNVYQTKFLLLQHGRYSDVQGLDDRMAAHMKQARNGGGVDDDDNDGSKKRGGGSEKALSIHTAGVALDALLTDIHNSLLPQNTDTSNTSNSSNHGNHNSTAMNRPASTSSTPRMFKSALEEAMLRDLVREVVSACKGSKFCPHCGAYSPRIRQDMSNKIFQSNLSATQKRMNAADGITIRPALTAKTRNSRDGDDSDNDDEEEKQGGYDSDDSMDNRKRNKNNNDDDVDDTGNDDDDDDDDDEDGATAKATPSAKKDKYMHAAEVQAQVVRTWETNPVLCNFLFAVQGPAIFFIQAIPVPPNRFRPPMNLGTMVVEHAQNGFLNKILEANELLRNHFASNNEAMAYKVWIDLQTHLNCYMDNSKDPAGVTQNTPMGIRQLLERKEGIFRKHMMGKRVNFACRSVISPDPYIGTNEIGLPQVFAETLTYPTPVTDINIGEMRTLVERGAFNYPGARWVEFPDRRVDLSKMDDHKREAIAARLLTYAKKGSQPAIVGRQLKDGDMVLMNRQVSQLQSFEKGPAFIPVRMSLCGSVVKKSKEETICHAPL